MNIDSLGQLAYGTFNLNLSGENKAEFDSINQIFAIGDLHGEYDTFVNLLQANGVIDASQNWIWGNGHLVICGDVFDRGNRVTECLWLIYRLESQAERSGGKVHFLLGNHELMILRDNNKYYVSDKYINLCANLRIDYHDFFGEDQELGRWLRRKNLIVKINDLIFVHGGIPPEFPGMGKSIQKINETIHYLINIPADSLDPLINHFAIQPAWYRGYLDSRDQTEELEEILNFYHAGRIIIGHTPVNEIKFIQNGKVIPVNVPFGHPGIVPQALLIKKEKFYVVDDTGAQVELK
jgi:hypothetical protein